MRVGHRFRQLHQYTDATNMIRQNASSLLSGPIVWFLSAAAFCGPLGVADEPEKAKEEETQRGEGLKNMKRSAAQYALLSADAPQRAFKFHETPAMRSSNAIGGSIDGVLYLWTDHGRPQAVLKLYTFNSKTYTHAWLSLSESPFVAERNGKVIWSPAEPGIKLREIPGAPQPAETAAKRLRQMKTLAAKFSATYTALNSDGKPFELRILTQPLLRYETDDDDRADGALFGYVQSTAPVGLLLLESRQTRDGHRWHYAYSSLTSGLVTARYGDEQVFSLERGNSHRDPQQPYLLFHSQPVPKE
jgi:hypothetical protein